MFQTVACALQDRVEGDRDQALMFRTCANVKAARHARPTTTAPGRFLTDFIQAQPETCTIDSRFKLSGKSLIKRPIKQASDAITTLGLSCSSKQNSTRNHVNICGSRHWPHRTPAQCTGLGWLSSRRWRRGYIFRGSGFRTRCTSIATGTDWRSSFWMEDGEITDILGVSMVGQHRSGRLQIRRHTIYARNVLLE